MDNCSVQDGIGNGVWVSGFGGHGDAAIRGGWMQNNSKCGVQVPRLCSPPPVCHMHGGGFMNFRGL